MVCLPSPQGEALSCSPPKSMSNPTTPSGATLALAAARFSQIESLARMARKHSERHECAHAQYGLRQISAQVKLLKEELQLTEV